MKNKNLTEKQSLRKKYLADRNAQEEADRYIKSRQILRKLSETKAFLQTEILLFYINFRSEVITTPLVEELLQKKEKRIFCPKVTGKDMDFYEITDMEQLVCGYQGIREPKQIEEGRFTDQQYHRHQCLMIMPGAVFDCQRGRIGYGKGFYDRFLLRYPDMKAIALAYDCQMAPAVPLEEYDKRPDMIITENMVITESEIII